MRAFHIRLSNDGMSPETLPIRDLAQLLQAVHLLLLSADGDDDDGEEVEGASDTPIISLAGVEASGSASVVFASENPEEAARLFNRGMEQIKRRPTSAHGQRAKELFREESKRLGTVIQFYPRGAQAPAAEVRPEDEPEVTSLVNGETTIYGRLVRIGGVRPKAVIDLDEGSRLSVNVSIGLAQKLAPYLYREVGIQGRAQWETAGWTMVHFTPDQVISFEPGEILGAFDELAEASGPEAWKGVADVVGAIAELRKGDDDL